MSGLLSTPRECLRGHGPMQEQPGAFALVGVDRVVQNALAAGAGFGHGATYKPNGRMFALKMWKCAICGAIELVDEA